MDDVVVVGYGTLRKQDFAGSSSSVGAKVIAETPPTTLENALQGRLAGVNITNISAGTRRSGVNMTGSGATSLSGG